MGKIPVTEHLYQIELTLPRYAFSPREVARAESIWRAFQEIAVLGSTRAGWPPTRYRREHCSWIMRSMRVIHDREAVWGEGFSGKTWISRLRRDTFSTRQVRLVGPEGTIARGQQEWAHVDGEMRPGRASASLCADLPPIDYDDGLAPLALPAFEPVEGDCFAFELTVWPTWIDPLGHVNHPTYLAWADESVSRMLAAKRIDPHGLVPVAEEVHYSRGVLANDRIRVETRRVGVAAGETRVFEHRILRGEECCARATTVRRLRGASWSD